MTQIRLRQMLPLALMPLAASATAQIFGQCTPTASLTQVPAGGSVTLQGNCVDSSTLTPLPSGRLNWEAVSGPTRQPVGQSALPDGTLTVTVPNLPGPVTYQIVSVDAGYGGPITVNGNGESPTPGITVTVVDPCPAPLANRSSPLGRKQAAIVNQCDTTPPVQPSTTQATLGQLTAPLTTIQTTRLQGNLDQASKRMRALRASRGTAALDLQGIPLPRATNDDDTNASDARRQRLGLYVTGLGDYLRQNASASQAEFRSRTTSLSIGADYRLNDEWVFGGNVGQANGRVEFSGSASEQKTRGLQATAYTAWSVTATTYVSATLSYEANRFEVARDDGNQGLATSAPKGRGTGLSVSAGRDFIEGPWSIGPYARWDHLTSSVDAFDESGSPSAVSVGAQRVRADVLNAGVQTQFSVPVSWGIVLPYVRLEFSHRSDKTRQAATATLINGNSTLLVPTSADTSGGYGNVAFGVAGVNQGGWSWFADIENGVAQKGYQTRRIGLGLRFEL